MEDREIKKAYEIVAADIEKFCIGGAMCNECILYEVCGENNQYLHKQIDMAKEILFGKKEEK
jgi:hypothetical protein